MRRLLLIAVVALIAVIGVAGSWSAPSGSDQAKRSISITKATDDHGVIRLTVRITGWKMYPKLVGKKASPDGGHWRIFVNGRYNNLSTNARSGSTNPRRALAPDSYTIDARLVRNNGSELSPRVRSKKITVTVEEPAETTE